jgi:hypothetical protein
MTDYLFYLKVWMFLRRIIIKKRLEFIDKVVLIVWDFKIGHYDIVRSVGPIVIIRVVDSISLTGKIQSLDDELIVLLQQRAPLNRSDWPIEDILIDKVVEAMIILSPLNHTVWLTGFHLAPVCYYYDIYIKKMVFVEMNQ